MIGRDVDGNAWQRRSWRWWCREKKNKISLSSLLCSLLVISSSARLSCNEEVCKKWSQECFRGEWIEEQMAFSGKMMLFFWFWTYLSCWWCCCCSPKSLPSSGCCGSFLSNYYSSSRESGQQPCHEHRRDRYVRICSTTYIIGCRAFGSTGIDELHWTRKVCWEFAWKISATTTAAIMTKTEGDRKVWRNNRKKLLISWHDTSSLLEWFFYRSLWRSCDTQRRMPRIPDRNMRHSPWIRVK